MANIILPQAKVLDTISNSATMLVEENGEIRRYNVTSLTEDFVSQVDNKPKAGFIYPLASATVPNGFLLCDGAAYSRTEYPELFTAIGTIYGSGDGSTTFNVPNLQTRVPVGSGEGYKLGDVGGVETHKHTEGDFRAMIGAANNNTGAIGYVPVSAKNPNTNESIAMTMGITSSTITSFTTMNHYTKVVGYTSTENNMQPYIVVNYVIATGKDTGVSVQNIIAGVQTLPLGVEYGGTGAIDAEIARRNLGIKKVARNLLDNSDFTNPVNQRGLTTYTGIGYTIDRWILAGNAGDQNTMWISTDGYIGLSGGDTTENVWLTQKIDPNIIPLGSKVTFAVKQNLGDIHILNIDSWGTDKLISLNNGITLIYQFGDEIVIYNGSGIPQGFNWAALYIGEYTAETLPEYQPKGYGAELLECRRYYRQTFSTSPTESERSYVLIRSANTNWLCSVIFDTPMRAIPTVTIYSPRTGTKDKISDWLTDEDLTQTVGVVESRNNFTVNCSGALDQGRSYYFHYTASADL